MVARHLRQGLLLFALLQQGATQDPCGGVCHERAAGPSLMQTLSTQGLRSDIAKEDVGPAGIQMRENVKQESADDNNNATDGQAAGENDRTGEQWLADLFPLEDIPAQNSTESNNAPSIGWKNSNVGGNHAERNKTDGGHVQSIMETDSAEKRDAANHNADNSNAENRDTADSTVEMNVEENNDAANSNVEINEWGTRTKKSATKKKAVALVKSAQKQKKEKKAGKQIKKAVGQESFDGDNHKIEEGDEEDEDMAALSERAHGEEQASQRLRRETKKTRISQPLSLGDEKKKGIAEPELQMASNADMKESTEKENNNPEDGNAENNDTQENDMENTNSANSNMENRRAANNNNVESNEQKNNDAANKNVESVDEGSNRENGNAENNGLQKNDVENVHMKHGNAATRDAGNSNAENRHVANNNVAINEEDNNDEANDVM